jgi:hypothetical protein
MKVKFAFCRISISYLKNVCKLRKEQITLRILIHFRLEIKQLQSLANSMSYCKNKRQKIIPYWSQNQIFYFHAVIFFLANTNFDPVPKFCSFIAIIRLSLSFPYKIYGFIHMLRFYYGKYFFPSHIWYQYMPITIFSRIFPKSDRTVIATYVLCMVYQYSGIISLPCHTLSPSSLAVRAFLDIYLAFFHPLNYP